MKLQFEFQDETIAFEHYLQNGLKVVQGDKEIQYNTCLHSAKVEKVFRGMLRKNMYHRVQNGEFETIENMLYEEIEKLKDIIHIFEKGIKLCEALSIEKEKLLTIKINNMDYEKLVKQVYPNSYIVDATPLWKVLTGEKNNRLIGWHAGYDATWHDAWQTIEKEKSLIIQNQ